MLCLQLETYRSTDHSQSVLPDYCLVRQIFPLYARIWGSISIASLIAKLKFDGGEQSASSAGRFKPKERALVTL
jgi:hypothetical protein